MAAPRRFDHDEARALYATGEWTIAALARRFGVTDAGMGLVVSDRQRAYYQAEIESGRRAEDLRQRYRRPCVRGCGRLAWHGPDPGRTGVCFACEKAERQAAAAARTARPGELLCADCGRWLPDNAFPSNRTAAKGRRGRHAQCRACNTAARRAYRERHKQPCVRCGKPRLSDAEQAASAKARGLKPSGLCHACWRAERSKPEPSGSEAVSPRKERDRSEC